MVTIADDDTLAKAEITGPTPGSHLSSSTVTFTWSGGHRGPPVGLSVGTTPGGTQIYDASQGADLSRTVSGLPTDGRAVDAAVVAPRNRVGGQSLHLARGGRGGPSLSIADATVTEGHAGTTSATFTVTLAPPSGATVTVGYATSDGTTTAGSDYAAASGTLTFAPQQATQTIAVPVHGDGAIEPNETFTVTLSLPTNATIGAGGGQATGTIVNDDPTLTVTRTGTGQVTSAPSGIACGSGLQRAVLAQRARHAHGGAGGRLGLQWLGRRVQRDAGGVPGDDGRHEVGGGDLHSGRESPPDGGPCGSRNWVGRFDASGDRLRRGLHGALCGEHARVADGDPAEGSVLVGWSGGCTGTALTCDLTINAAKTVTASFDHVNRAPVLDAIGDKSVEEGATLSFTVSATDADGDALTYSASNLPPGSTFDPATRSFSWTPTYAQAGSYAGVLFTVADAKATDSETITITVTDNPTPPGFYTLTPCRVLDTRDPNGPHGGPALVAGADRAFTITGQCDIPSTAMAVSVNLTVTQPSAPGTCVSTRAASRYRWSRPSTTRRGVTRANSAIVSLNELGKTGGAPLPGLRYRALRPGRQRLLPGATRRESRVRRPGAGSRTAGPSSGPPPRSPGAARTVREARPSRAMCAQAVGREEQRTGRVVAHEPVVALHLAVDLALLVEPRADPRVLGRRRRRG